MEPKTVKKKVQGWDEKTVPKKKELKPKPMPKVYMTQGWPQKGQGWDEKDYLVTPEGVETVTIDATCKVYLFFFEGFVQYPELETALIAWGNRTGKNLNVVRLSEADEQYSEWLKMFEIRQTPALAISGSGALASIVKDLGTRTAFVRLDQEKLLKDTPEVMSFLMECYNLFLQGKFKEAMENVEPALGQIKFGQFLQKGAGMSSNFIEYVKTHKIDVSIGPIKIALEKDDGKDQKEKKSGEGGKKTTK